MIYSMTGYGIATRELTFTHTQGTGHLPTARLTIELRSVNSRFLDLAFRAPEDCRWLEPPLRDVLTAALVRGKVECRIHLQRTEESGETNAVNLTTLAQLKNLENLIAPHFPQAGTLRMGEILRWPGLLAEPQLDPDIVKDAALDCCRVALTQLRDSRNREGTALTRMLQERIDAMLTITHRITPLIPQLISQHQQKLTERLQQAMDAVTANGAQLMSKEEVAERIRQEITVYGIRIDIAEELSRLETHLQETRHLLEKGGPLGKRLDFMMQELNREANTLGSKAAAKELADASMELKLLIEQMREQVQNLE